MADTAKISLKAQAYQYLKEKILSCAYEPGQILNEGQLCAEMGNISRTPMRDAISRLESEGFVQIRPKKGIVVAKVTPQMVRDIYEARMVVEPYSLYYYGHLLDKRMLADWLERFRAMDSSSGEYPTVEEDIAFHKMLLSAMPNDYLHTAYDRLARINNRIIILTNRVHPRPRNVQQEHIAILEALLAEEPARAANAMRQHLLLSQENTLAVLGSVDSDTP